MNIHTGCICGHKIQEHKILICYKNTPAERVWRPCEKCYCLGFRKGRYKPGHR